MGSEVKEEDCLAIIAIKTHAVAEGGAISSSVAIKAIKGGAQSHPVTNCEERLELSLLPFQTIAHTVYCTIYYIIQYTIYPSLPYHTLHALQCTH